jgi:hypothetical protein
MFQFGRQRYDFLDITISHSFIIFVGMKKLRYLLTITAILLTISAYTQDSCRVLTPELQGTYNGECKDSLADGYGKAAGKDSYEGYFKKGLPHGKGTYYWSTGEVFTGFWFMGKRNGLGRFTFKINGKDTTITGIWKDNIYTGPKPKDPEVVRFTNIDKYEFRKGTTNLSRVLIDFRQNGMTNTQVSNIMMTASSGTETKVGQMIGYENLTFPVTFKIRYNSFNKMKTVRYNCYIEFTIYEKGDWVVKLIN